LSLVFLAEDESDLGAPFASFDIFGWGWIWFESSVCFLWYGQVT